MYVYLLVLYAVSFQCMREYTKKNSSKKLELYEDMKNERTTIKYLLLSVSFCLSVVICFRGKADNVK